jgi:molecular chaperone GrpE
VQSQNLLSRLGRRLGFRPIPADVAEELSALRTEVSAQTQAQLEHHDRMTALREAIEKLEKQIARAGKEQFKANSLAEAQQQSAKSTLEQLREANAYRERELADLRERLVGARAEGRMEVIKRLLPVLDGIDEALSAGQRQIVDAPTEANRSPDTGGSLSFRRRVRGAWALLAGKLPNDLQPAVWPAPSNGEALAAWLEGLGLVRDRLLDILAAEGVRPIETDGEMFDPNVHVSVSATLASDGLPAGSIVQATRRGYRIGEAVLRYAEVVVAR